MEKYNKTIGKAGEATAIKYLKKNKYRILEENYSTKLGEIDIIAQKDDYIVFIEVKTRSSDDYGGGAAAVTYTKQQHIIKSAQFYLLCSKNDCSARFDVIVIDGHMKKNKFICDGLNHIENAFF